MTPSLVLAASGRISSKQAAVLLRELTWPTSGESR
jgi:hypothetical protein